MRYALVSDIHANLQAWTAVENDLARMKPDQVICLGDIVGYGPNPVEVLERVYQRCHHFVMGNHDAAICGQFDPADFNEEAREVILWSRRQLNDQAVAVLNETPYLLLAERFSCSHAEFELPERFDYIFEPSEAETSFAATEAPILFVGHTHVPCTMRRNADGTTSHLKPAAFNVLPGCRYLVNVGSVGDPRDGTTRASYVIFDDQTGAVEFRSVPFNVEAYRQALAASGLPTKPYLFDVLEKKQREIIETRVRSFQKRAPGAPSRAITPQQVARISRSDTRRPMQVRRKGEHVFAGASYKPSPARPEPKRRSWLVALFLLLFVAGVTAGVLIFRGGGNKPTGEAAAPPVAHIQIGRAQLDRIVDDVREGKRTHHDAHAELQRLDAAADSNDKLLISRAFADLRDAVKQGESAVIFDLNSKAAELAGKKNFAGADKLLRDYTGPFAEETRKRRLEEAAKFSTEIESQSRESRARVLGKLDKAREKIVLNLASLWVDSALKELETLAGDPEVAAMPEFAQLKDEVQVFISMRDRICEEFLKQKGMSKTLTIQGKLRDATVLSVKDCKIAFRLDAGGGSHEEKSFYIKDLDPGELLSRLGPPTPDAAGDAWRALLWSMAGKPDQARSHFEKCNMVLCRDLQEHFRKHPVK
jgi:predicted phosphodiesterase